LANDSYSQWAAGLTENTIRAMFVDRGCDAVFRKVLAPNDNTKNQIYLAGDLTEIARIPSGPIGIHAGTSTKQRAPGASIFRAPLDLVWITDLGAVPAPEAKLIYYPQYPEVRASGLLRGTSGAPNHLLDPGRDGRAPGRVLLLGVSSGSDRIHALLLPPDCPAARQLGAAHLRPYGVLGEWTVTATSRPAPADPRSQLVEELGRVHRLDWIPSCRLNSAGERIPYTAQNGAGFTLEAELGVIPNGHAAPDLLGWEVKQHSVRSFAKPAYGVVTLLTPEPDGGLYATHGAVDFVQRWGRRRKAGEDRLDFTGRHSVGKYNDRTGLTLRLDGFDAKRSSFDPNGRIALVTPDDETCASWSFGKLLGHWKRKHAAAVFVQSERRPSEREGDQSSYRYGRSIQLCEGASFERLLEGFASGLVVYDPGLHIDRRADGSWRPRKRNQFRVSSRPERLATLYERSVMEDVGSRTG
jgi:hypothetical protein